MKTMYPFTLNDLEVKKKELVRLHDQFVKVLAEKQGRTLSLSIRLVIVKLYFRRTWTLNCTSGISTHTHS